MTRPRPKLKLLNGDATLDEAIARGREAIRTGRSRAVVCEAAKREPERVRVRRYVGNSVQNLGTTRE